MPPFSVHSPGADRTEVKPSRSPRLPIRRRIRHWNRRGLHSAVTPLALALVALTPTAAHALTAAERALLVQSVRKGELPGLEAGFGGIDRLPLLAVEVNLHEETRTIEGFARLDWPNRTGKPLDHLVYRLVSNGAEETPFVDWTELQISIDGGEPVPVKSQRLSPKHFRIALPKPLPPDERVVVQGALVGRLARVDAGGVDPAAGLNLSGLLGSKKKKPAPHSGAQYGTLACGQEICTVTGFAPEIPAFLDGAFDTTAGSGIGDPAYSEPVNLLLNVVTRSDSVVAATGVETGRVPAGEGRRRTTFALIASREAGFVASPRFVVDEADVNGTRVRSFSLRRHRAAGKRVLETATGSMTVFDDAFGRYPWSTLNVAASELTGGAGGVELPALTLVGAEFYGPPPPQLALAASGEAMWREMLDFITRHEVAHEWWHAQVGSHPQLHPYIDEPLAQWSALLATAKTAGNEAAVRAREQQVAMNYRALAIFGVSDGVVARPADAFASPIEYAGLVYGKAPLFYIHLRQLIGADALLKALKGVVAKHRFRMLTPDALRAALVKAGGSKGPQVEKLWQRWFHETHGEADIGPLSLSSFIDGVAGQETVPPELRELMDNIDPGMIQDAIQQLQEIFGGEL